MKAMETLPIAERGRQLSSPFKVMTRKKLVAKNIHIVLCVKIINNLLIKYPQKENVRQTV